MWRATPILFFIAGCGCPAPSQPSAAPVRAKPTTIPAGPRPVIRVDSSEHDFGTVWAGDSLTHTFTIRNEGNATLEFDVMRVGGYHAPDHRTVPPGGSEPVTIKRSWNNDAGEWMTWVTLKSNDPVTPDLRLTVHAKTRSCVEWEPRSFEFRDVTDQAPRHARMRIRNTLEAPINVSLEPLPAGKIFRFELATITPGREWELRATTVPPYPEGFSHTTVTLQTTGPGLRSLTISACVFRPPRLELRPAMLAIPQPTPQDPDWDWDTVRTITLLNWGNTPVKLLAATADDPAITTRIRQVKRGKQYEVEVRFPPGYVSPTDHPTIRLTTDDPQKPTLDVPIRRYRTGATTQPTTRAATSRPQ